MSFPEPWQDLTPDDWSALARAHGTPFYLFDADWVAARIQRVRQALQDQAQIYYAVKANPNLGLLRALRTEADGVDISSGGEQVQSELAGFAAAQMSFAGPAKSDAELEAAIAAGIGCISVESMREIDACARIAHRLGTAARLLLRVNPEQLSCGYGLKMTGRATQFGIDEEMLPQAVARILEQGSALNLLGIHAYVGSQCFDAAGVIDATGNALRIAAVVERLAGFACRKINLGGGFGVAVSGERRELDLVALAPGLVPLLAAYRRERPDCELLFELGRYITAEAGIYVTSVVSTKQSRGKAFVACDGGLNHQLAAAGTFGAALRGNFPLLNLSCPEADLKRCNVAGPSCNPTDLLGVDVSVPAPREGDLLGVLMSGSYGLTASPLLFLGRDTPTELVRQNGQIEIGRRPHRMTDFN